MRISDWSSDVCSSDLSRDPGTDNRHQESVILNARISALKERIERYNAQPRREFVGPSAQEVDYAEYVEAWRSEEHTSELQSLMRISYAVFCLKKKTNGYQKKTT